MVRRAAAPSCGSVGRACSCRAGVTPPHRQRTLPITPGLQRDSCSIPSSLQHPSPFRENGVYVELSKRVIPAEWMEAGSQAEGRREEPCSRAEAALPWAPEGQK